MTNQNKWFVYILKCSDDTFYTGITNDLDRRIYEHNESDKWAKYTKMRRPVELIYSANFENRSEASKQEHNIKKLSRKEKIELISKK